jgi:signal transduction histidine kinase
VDPELVTTNPVAPYVLIEDVLMDGVPRMVTSPFERTGPGLQIPPGKKQVEFRYTATSLTAPEKVRFRYRLEGLEPTWSTAGPRRSASYSRLPPGDYKFHVIACNNDGVWNEEGDSLAIMVLPFFWQTKWFEALTSLALVAAIFASARVVVARRLKLKLERLEREHSVNRERARIAKDIHDDLGASLTEIMLLSEFAQNTNTPLEAQEDIRKIAIKSRALTQLLDEIVWAVNPHRDTLENFVTYACSYAEDFLRMAQIQCRLKLQPTFPDMFLRTDIRHALFLMVKEALNNIVKHAKASEVTISMELDGAEFHILIEDNGKGFQMERKGGPSLSEDVLPRSGEGLFGMRERVENLQGQFEIFTQPGQGTRIKIQVPIHS